MSPVTSTTAFAAASAAMVRGVDGPSIVHVLLADCLTLLGADSAGVLVNVGDHGLELLAATSHEAVELELFQSQVRNGPCVESIESGRTIEASGEEQIVHRWADFGRAMSAAGFLTVHAAPMRWHDRVLGGMNLFWHAERVLSTEERELAQAFADIGTLALMQTAAADDSASLANHLRVALEGRVVIERAKGVLAQTEQLEMGEAFARLVDLSKEREEPLMQVAQTILSDIVTPRG